MKNNFFFLAAALFFFCVGHPPLLAAFKMYVTNGQSCDVSVIDSLTQEVIKTIPVGNPDQPDAGN